MVLALFTIACLTNPRVRFGRSLNELNIQAPFRLCRGRFFPIGKMESPRLAALGVVVKAKSAPRGRKLFRSRRLEEWVKNRGGTRLAPLAAVRNGLLEVA
jgi:hypothetical protein